MDIIFHGIYVSEEAAESFLSVLRLLKERYKIERFNDVHLSMVLLDQSGNEVELVDTDTGEAYRRFEIYRGQKAPSKTTVSHGTEKSPLHLVIDNTHGSEG